MPFSSSATGSAKSAGSSAGSRAGSSSGTAGRAVINAMSSQDGRFARLKAGLLTEINDLKTSVAEACSFEQLVDEEQLLGTGKALQTCVKNQLKLISKAVTACRACAGRIDRSTNRDALTEQANAVNKWIDNLEVGQTALKALGGSSASYNEVVEALKSACDHGIGLSKTMGIIRWYQVWGAKGFMCRGIYFFGRRLACSEHKGSLAINPKELAQASLCMLALLVLLQALHLCKALSPFLSVRALKRS